MSIQKWSQAPQRAPKPLLQGLQGSYQGHVIQDEPEGCSALRKVVAHLSGDQLSLGDKFSSIKASLDPREGRESGQDKEEAERENWEMTSHVQTHPQPRSSCHLAFSA